MRKFHALTAAALAIGAATLTTPAQADEYDGYCNTGEVCQYRLESYTGGVVDLIGTEYNYEGWTFFSNNYSLNDRTTSLKNAAQTWGVTHYQNAGHTGGALATNKDTWRSYVGSGFDNIFSSHKMWQ